ncbi:ribosomal RNA-processing protein 8-like [Saccostrea echinata]|uniref:ribosomal RNA-processing protein 8-like n=1 Tax=Saccostrea echinata TaxID=191078 RepID=UPI002A8249BD|nr:ribosomal RNA-processing protein 8-like [Saccostrea echinata]
MDFDPESWESSAETDRLNQDLFGKHRLSPKKGKDQKRQMKQRIGGDTDEYEAAEKMSHVKKKGKKRKHEATSSDDISTKKMKNMVDIEGSMSEGFKILKTKKKGKKSCDAVNSDGNSKTVKEGVGNMDFVSENTIKSNTKRGKKTKHKSVFMDGNATTKKRSVENMDTVLKSNDSETRGEKKRKNRNNKNKFKTESPLTQNPGGKNFQKRDIKEKIPCDSNVTLVTHENVSKTQKTDENLKGKKVKHLHEALPISVCDVTEQTSQEIEKLESSDSKGNRLAEVKGKKKIKPKADSSRPRRSKHSDITSKEQDSLITVSRSSNRKVKKKTFNTAILSGILAADSESKKVKSKDKLNEIGKKEDMSEPQAKKKKKKKNNKMEEHPSEKECSPTSLSLKEENPPKPQSLKERLMEQLNSARFRYINEQLYTHSGQEAQEMFAEDEEAFQVYHQGFQTQVNKWPVNPVDMIIQDINKLPRNKVVADFGCGDAKIARGVPQKVHSFDLVALNDHVTACDMSHVPLDSGSVDIAVFCLSLMGTNLTDYLAEAQRVLKMGGRLKIAEVASRFQSLPQFLINIEQFGFYQESKDTSNKMFYLFNFKKTGKPKSKLPAVTLQPCMYKKR